MSLNINAGNELSFQLLFGWKALQLAFVVSLNTNIKYSLWHASIFDPRATLGICVCLIVFNITWWEGVSRAKIILILYVTPDSYFCCECVDFTVTCNKYFPWWDQKSHRKIIFNLRSCWQTYRLKVKICQNDVWPENTQNFYYTNSIMLPIWQLISRNNKQHQLINYVHIRIIDCPHYVRSCFTQVRFNLIRSR